MPLGGFRLIDHALATLAEIGVRRVLVVVGPHSGELAAHLASLRPRCLAIETAIQLAPRGTADALLAAEAFAVGGPFSMVNSDNLYPAAALAELAGTAGWAHLVLDRGRVRSRFFWTPAAGGARRLDLPGSEARGAKAPLLP